MLVGIVKEFSKKVEGEWLKDHSYHIQVDGICMKIKKDMFVDLAPKMDIVLRENKFVTYGPDKKPVREDIWYTRYDGE